MLPLFLTKLLPAIILLRANQSVIQQSPITQYKYNPTCIDDYIEEIGKNFSYTNMTKIIQRAMMELEYSGTYYNSQGNYQKCISSENRSYYILFLDPGLRTVGHLFYALCLNSSSCTGDDVKELVNNLEINLKVTQVIQPKTIEKNIQIPWYTFFIGGIIIFFIFLTIVMSILNGISSIGPKIKQSTKLKYLNMFAIQNTKQMLVAKPTDIKFLNGVKGLCFLLVVVGHQQILIAQVTAILNIYSISLIQNQILTIIFLSYLLAIDLFLYIGGFLIGYYFPKKYLKQQNIWIFFKVLLHRISRFLPMFIIAIFFYWLVMPAFVQGPFSWQAYTLTAHCENTWWRDILFFGNFSEMCMSWSWYIEVDLQLFILCLFFLWIYTRINRTLSTFVQYLTIIGSLIYLGVMCTKYKYRIWATLQYLISEKCQQYIKTIYYSPFTRISVYVFGLAIGIFYFQYGQYKQKLKQKQAGSIKRSSIIKFTIKQMQSKRNRIICMFIGLTLILILIFTPYTTVNHQWSQTQHSTYLTLGRLIFVFAVFLLTLPLLLGYSNPIGTFLQAKVLQFICKISYSSYLLHNIYIIWRNTSTPYTYYLTPQFLFIKSITDLLPILVGGFIFAICIQFPIALIIQELTGRKTNSRLRSNTGEAF